MSQEDLLKLLRDEFKSLHVHVQQLGVALARLEEKHKHSLRFADELKDLRIEMALADRRLVKVSGINGNNGKLSEVAEQVAANGEKIQSLVLSRAAIVAYATAAGGAASLLAKVLL